MEWAMNLPLLAVFMLYTVGGLATHLLDGWNFEIIYVHLLCFSKDEAKNAVRKK